MEIFEVQVIDHSAAVVVHLRGEMSLKLDAMETAFNRIAARKPPMVVVDLSGVTFISSLAMGLLVALRGGTRHHSLVRLACPTGLVLDALKRAKLTDLFEIFESVEQAIAAKIPEPARK